MITLETTEKIKSLKEIYNDICVETAKNWQSEGRGAVSIEYLAKIIGTSIPAMKGMLKRNLEMVEVLPDYYTTKEFALVY